VKINNVNPGNLSSNGKDISRIDQGEKKQSVTAPQHASKASKANGHSQEAKVKDWTLQFQALPEPRVEVVKNAIAKLENGGYGSRDAAEQAARRILGQ